MSMTAYTEWAIKHPWHVTGQEPRPPVPADCDCETCQWGRESVGQPCPLCGELMTEGDVITHRACADEENAWNDRDVDDNSMYFNHRPE